MDINQAFKSLYFQIDSLSRYSAAELPRWKIGKDLIQTYDPDNIQNGLINLKYGEGLQVMSPENSYPLAFNFTLIRKGELFYKIVPDYLSKNTNNDSLDTLKKMSFYVRCNQPNLKGYTVSYDCSSANNYKVNFNVVNNFLKEGKGQPWNIINPIQRWNLKVPFTASGAKFIDEIPNIDNSTSYMKGIPCIWECYKEDSFEQIFTDTKVRFLSYKDINGYKKHGAKISVFNFTNPFIVQFY